MMTSRRSMMRNFKLAVAIAVIACAFVTGTTWQSAEPRDFYQFWVVGQAVERYQVRDIYAKRDRRQLGERLAKAAEQANGPLRNAGMFRSNLETAGTPFMYAIFFVVSTGEFHLDYRNFRIVCAIAFLLGLYALLLAAGLHPVVAGGALLALRWFYPLYLDVRFSNVSMLQVGMIALFIYSFRPPASARSSIFQGFLCSLMILFKPNLVFVGIFTFLWEAFDQRWKKLRFQGLGAAIAAVLAIALSQVVLGHSVLWAQWYPQFQSIVFEPKFLSQSLLSMVTGVKNLWIYKIVALVGLGGIVLLLRPDAGRTLESAAQMEPDGRLVPADFRLNWLMTAMSAAFYLLTAPLVHGHYFLLTLPLACYFLRPDALGHKGGTLTSPCFWICLMSVVVIGSHPFFKTFGMAQAPYHDILTFVGTGMLMILAVAELIYLRSPRSLILEDEALRR